MCCIVQKQGEELTICRTCKHCYNGGYWYNTEDWVCLAHEEPAVVTINILTGATQCEMPNARYIHGHVYTCCSVINDGACPDWAEIEETVVTVVHAAPRKNWWGRLCDLIDLWVGSS